MDLESPIREIKNTPELTEYLEREILKTRPDQLIGIEVQRLKTELRKEKAINALLIDHLPGPALLVQPTTQTILFANQEAVHLGAIPGESILKPSGMLDQNFPWKLMPDFDFEKPQPIEIEFQGRFWDVRWIQINSNLYLHFAIDITKAKQIDQERREFETRQDSFIWVTSHELRTPLSVIRGYTEFLIRSIDQIPVTRRDRILSIISRNIGRLEQLSEQVGMLTQVQAGSFLLNSTEIQFCEFLRNVVEPYRDLLDKQIQVTISGCGEENPVIIEGDPNRIRQVLENLIENAIKHTSDSIRSICVSLEVFPNNIRVSVTDNGAGIAPHNLERIFEPFISIPTQFSVTGVGLGLYLSRQIIESHNSGQLIASSRGMGLGATFTFLLYRKL